MKLLLAITILFSASAFAKGRIQNSDIKTTAECIAAGATAACVPNDDKVYITANGLNKTLKQSLTDGDFQAKRDLSNLNSPTVNTAINMGNNEIVGLGAPTTVSSAATKAYVDGVSGTFSPFIFYARKMGSMYTISSGSETNINTYDSPLENVGVGGNFNNGTGAMTIPATGVYYVAGRAGIVANSGAEIFTRLYINGVVCASSWGQSISVRGNVASCIRTISAGQLVQMRVQTQGTQSLQSTADAPIFLNIVRLR